MCDQGKKVRGNQGGESRNALAPASHENQNLPVDCQNLKCYNGITRQNTCDHEKGAGKCDGVERTNTNEAFREAIKKQISDIIDRHDQPFAVSILTYAISLERAHNK